MVKFTQQLKFNGVPEWREHYVQYGHLKKYIYALAKWEADHAGEHGHTSAGSDVEATLATPLLPSQLAGSQQVRAGRILGHVADGASSLSGESAARDAAALRALVRSVPALTTPAASSYVLMV